MPLFHVFPTAISCGTMNSPTNGSVRLDGGTVIGAMAFYNCQTGFRLVGDGLRVCGSNGLWSGEEPICSKSTTNYEESIVHILFFSCKQSMC